MLSRFGAALESHPEVIDVDASMDLFLCLPPKSENLVRLHGGLPNESILTVVTHNLRELLDKGIAPSPTFPGYHGCAL